MVPQKSKNHPRNLTSRISIANLVTFTVNYISPPIVIWLAFSDLSPAYGFILQILNVKSIHVIIRIIIAIHISVTFNTFASVTYLCALLEVGGIVVLHFWSNILLKDNLS